jgi:hypothetical protein
LSRCICGFDLVVEGMDAKWSIAIESMVFVLSQKWKISTVLILLYSLLRMLSLP